MVTLVAKLVRHDFVLARLDVDGAFGMRMSKKEWSWIWQGIERVVKGGFICDRERDKKCEETAKFPGYLLETAISFAATARSCKPFGFCWLPWFSCSFIWVTHGWVHEFELGRWNSFGERWHLRLLNDPAAFEASPTNH
jgi:hypothetical protein